MDAVRREPEEDSQITDCPNEIARASLHKAYRTRWPSQRGRHDAASLASVKSKIPRFPREITSFHDRNRRLFYCAISLVFAAVLGPANAQSEPASEGEHEREELGVNRYPTPRIDRLF